ncbi:MAG: saccharopine dehydrogenase NADP-binding domain-containing protein [Anaerolineae bacterium]|nr:saccharopine dehydrogenase NADP-binding domain-containing protein [Anaerolineae bacterium]
MITPGMQAGSQAEKILVAGGYGNVGRIIATSLGEVFPGRVIAAGRNLERAQNFAAKTHGKVLARHLDLSSDVGNALDDVKLAIVCLDQADTRFVEACLQRSIHYTDISADAAFMAQVMALAPGFEHYGATAVLSVGLSPGITNLLVKQASQSLESVDHANIYVILGLGEVHGDASIRWMIRKANQVYEVNWHDTHRQMKSFDSARQTWLASESRNRTFFAFDLPEQHTLPNTLGIPTGNWLAFDSVPMTHLIAFSNRIGLMKLFQRGIRQTLFIHGMQRFRIGSDRFLAEVHVVGQQNGQPLSHWASVGGFGEGRATGLAAAELAKRLYRVAFPPGAYHIEQLVEPESFFEALSAYDLVFKAGSLTDDRTRQIAHP